MSSPQVVGVEHVGRMPGAVAVLGLLFCLPLGLVMIAFTRWSLGQKVGVGLFAVALWIIVLAALGQHH